MSTGQKITFGGNTVGTNYSVKQVMIQRSPNSYGYVSGETVNAASVPYQGQSTNLYGDKIAVCPPYIPNVTYGGQSTTPTYTGGFNTSAARFENNPTYTGGANYVQTSQVGGKSTKITFGGKPHTEIYTPIQQTTYMQPVPPAQTIQTYETYRQPTEIQTITSQPIREEVRYEQKVEPVRSQFKEEYTTSVPAPVVERKKKTKKGGCPSWIWILLGVLVLAGLIVGLVFLFGGFGGAAAAGPKPVSNNGTVTADIEDGSSAAVSGNATTPATTTNATTTQPAITQPTTTTTDVTTTQPTTTTDTTTQPTTTTTTTTGTTQPTETTTGTTTDTTAATGTTYVTPTTPTTQDNSIEPDFSGSTPSPTTTTSPATTSPATTPTGDYYAPSTDYSSPSAGYVSPSTDYSSPSTDYSSPSAGYASPSADYSSPSAGYASPSTDYSSPSADYVSPSSDFAQPTTVY